MRRFGTGVFAASLSLTALPASAHLVATGVGPVYDSILHWALTPEQLLPMAALALYAGMRGPKHARWLLFILPPAWFAGSLAGFFPPPALPAFAGGFALLLAGVLLACDAKIPPYATVGLALAYGVTLGGLYGEPADAGASNVLADLGVGAFIFMVLALLSSVSLPLSAPAAKIAVRVGGSWAAALGLLLVGWWVRGYATGI